MPINCIIIEDEPLAMERTRRFVQKVPYLTLSGTFQDGEEALQYLQNHQQATDLIFLDIHIGQLSGIQLLELVKPDCEVIITTAFDQYAIKGYDLQVADYLLKPFTFERFEKAVQKARKSIEAKRITEERPFVFIKTENRKEKVYLDEILYIEGMRDYRKIHTAGKKLMTLQTFGDLEKEIPSGIIARVHKSFMVAVNRIQAVDKNTVVIANTVIPVSETYKTNLKELLNKPL
jgi:DNA-binding LytR/AlgR family response regulator